MRLIERRSIKYLTFWHTQFITIRQLIEQGIFNIITNAQHFCAKKIPIFISTHSIRLSETDFVFDSCHFYHILFLSAVVHDAHTIRRLSNYKSRVSLCCFFACVSLGQRYQSDNSPNRSNNSNNNGNSQVNYSCDNIYRVFMCILNV